MKIMKENLGIRTGLRVFIRMEIGAFRNPTSTVKV